jgi:hypothetical protein
MQGCCARLLSRVVAFARMKLLTRLLAGAIMAPVDRRRGLPPIASLSSRDARHSWSVPTCLAGDHISRDKRKQGTVSHRPSTEQLVELVAMRGDRYHCGKDMSLGEDVIYFRCAGAGQG